MEQVRGTKIKGNIIDSMLAAMLPAFTFCIYGPLEIYLSNIDEFWFTLGTFVHIPIIFFIAAVLVLTVIGVLLKGKFADAFRAFVFGTGIAVYLQANFMGIKPGLMNGNSVDWGSYSGEMIFNLIVWIMIIAIAVITALKNADKVKKPFRYISAVICMMQLVSLIVLLLSSGASFERSTSKFLSSDKLYEVGKEENIIVFVVDAFDNEYVNQLKEAEPAVLSRLSGFTRYDNYTGLYPSTLYSMAHLAGGNVFRNEYPLTEWVNKNAEDRIYLDELTDDGYDMSIYTDMPRDIASRIAEECENYVVANLDFYNARTCFSLMYKLVGCGYLPDIVKPYIWMDGTEFTDAAKSDTTSRLYESKNAAFRDGLKNQGLSVSEGKKFKLIHIFGAHEPFRIGKDGEDVEENWDNDLAAAEGSLNLVCNYIDEMKAQGVYDASSIIIMSDHGWHGADGVLSNPILFIKEKGADASKPLCSASQPVSQEDVPAAILKLAGIADYGKYGEAVFDIPADSLRERILYQYVNGRDEMKNGNYCLIEYKVPALSNDVKAFEMTDAEYTWDGEKVSHKDGCKTCQSNKKPEKCYKDWESLIHEHK